MLRQPVILRQEAIDESTDAYDTIEWLLKNVPNNNGRSGWQGQATARADRDGMLDPAPCAQGGVRRLPRRICGSAMTSITTAHFV